MTLLTHMPNLTIFRFNSPLFRLLLHFRCVVVKSYFAHGYEWCKNPYKLPLHSCQPIAFEVNCEQTRHPSCGLLSLIQLIIQTGSHQGNGFLGHFRALTISDRGSDPKWAYRTFGITHACANTSFHYIFQAYV